MSSHLTEGEASLKPSGTRSNSPFESERDRPPQAIDIPNCLGADFQTCGAFIHDRRLLNSYRLLLTNRWLLIPYSPLK